MRIESLDGVVYQGISEFPEHLDAELARTPGRAAEAWGALRFVEGPEIKTYWTQNVWRKPIRVEFDSIGEAANALRGIQRNWAPYLYNSFRRGTLIQDKLPPISAKPKAFPFILPDSPMGAFTLLDEKTMIASADCSSPFPGGIPRMAEDKEGPPSRAYLKVQEALIRARVFPQRGERCLDAGASPGGWTWVVAGLGARVLAVDRADLDPRVAAMEGVETLRHDAFTLKPEDIGPCDWVFSDVICYPPRLLEWVQAWLDSGLARNFVCTIKMQGEPDWDTVDRFASIPGSSVVHLFNNKHELTWTLLESRRASMQNDN